MLYEHILICAIGFRNLCRHKNRVRFVRSFVARPRYRGDDMGFKASEMNSANSKWVQILSDVVSYLTSQDDLESGITRIDAQFEERIRDSLIVE